MAVSIDWGTKIITVPQADLLQTQSTPIEVYELNINDFRLELTELLGEAPGMPFVDTHIYNPPVTVAGVTLARVLEIINGYTITFSPDSSYGVNVVGGNSNIADVTNPNNVSVRSANSAGLQDAQSLQAASFLGHVSLDVINGVSGTTFPRGTQQTPVNNLIDAKQICEDRGLSQILVVNDFTLNGGTDLTAGFVFYAEKKDIIITIDTSADVSNCTFKDLSVTGVLDNNNLFTRCEVFDATHLDAALINCGIRGTLTLGGGGTSELVNCYSDVAGGGAGQTPSIDMGGTGNSLLLRDWSGGLELINYGGGGDISLDYDSGRLLVDSTVTAGDVYVRGICAIDDQSTGTATVHDQTLTVQVDEIPNRIIPHIWGSD